MMYINNSGMAFLASRAYLLLRALFCTVWCEEGVGSMTVQTIIS